jgi:hypothetical protein
MPLLDLATSGLGVVGDLLTGVVKNAGIGILVVLALSALRAVREDASSRPRQALSAVATLVLAAVTLGVAYGLLKTRTGNLTGALGRWDHWILCALLGQLLGSVTQRWNVRALVLTSFVFVAAYVGTRALSLNLGAGLAGWAAIRFGLGRWPRVALAVQPCIILGVLAFLLAVRPSDQLLALQGWGLACWAMMRHVSFVVEARHGASTRLDDYLCYLFFFPSCLGAMETYDEFSSRNLEQRRRPELGAALVGAIRADVFVRVALRVPISPEAWLAGTGFTELWGLSLLSFARAALFLEGVWSMVEADARLLGVVLRPNFTGVLTAPNPSRFWRAWRGTMTHWLIRYVYIPLGGNRRHRTRNIFAAFAVSTIWHAGGVLFALQQPILPPASGAAFVPVVAWGVLNFAGVAAHSAWRRRWPAGTWLPESSLASRAVKIALTLCFGSLTVTVLGFPANQMAEFPRIMCTFAGLAHVCGR